MRIRTLLSAICLVLALVACGQTEPDAPEVPDAPIEPDTTVESDTPVEPSKPNEPEKEEKEEKEEKGYFLMSETKTAYTGEELSIGLDDPKYGGAQFVSKLFTEGLGRGPEPEEYLEYMDILESADCTVETLKGVAGMFFDSKAFTSLALEPAYEAMAVYRAVLNRDPTLVETQSYATRRAAENAADIAASLVETDEFAALLPDIIRGPYYWGLNNAEYSPSGIILTSDEVNAMLGDVKRGGTLELEQGTLVLVTSSIVIPSGRTLTTKGSPTHYTQQARILRVANNTDRVVVCNAGALASHIWVDGNRTAFAHEELAAKGNSGANIGLMGNNAAVTDCRTNGSTSGTHIFGADAISGILVQHCLVTAYETGHHKDWADGITIASTKGTIEDNTVIDATDVGIIVFRYVSKGQTVPQTTVVRNNTILNLGNSAYAGIDIDAWNNQGATQNFRGTRFENNALWTSYKAHQHICLSLATLAWHNVIGDEAIGSDVINNYTPEGLHVLCGAVFAADGCHEFVARGNHISAYIGPWGNSNASALLRERISSINPETADGDLQGEYEELTMWLPYKPFILAHTAPPLAQTPLKGAIFHENRVERK